MKETFLINKETKEVKKLLFDKNIPSSCIKFAIRPVHKDGNNVINDNLWEPKE